MKDFSEYKNFVECYKPYSWEISKDETRDQYKNQHSFEINFIRFYKVYQILKLIKDNKSKKILDVGSYPGNLIKLCEYLFEDKLEFTALGLGFDDKKIKRIKKESASLINIINTEIDPDFPEPSSFIDWNIKDYDIALLLDVIEHLNNPNFTLEKINKSLKINGYLIITTDNITNILYIMKMMARGQSPNIHPVMSSIFYRGDHRPHFKEYSKEELEFLLNYNGFELVRHEYFNRQQGSFYIKGNKICKKNFFKNIADFTLNCLVKFFNIIPHFRNHHIILAKKINNYEDIIKSRFQTKSMSEWLKFREEYYLSKKNNY